MTEYENKEFFREDSKFPEKIMALYGKELLRIKEDVKEFFYRNYGYYPSNSEGCCYYCAEKLKDLLKGQIVGGYFINDRKISKHEVEVPSNFGKSWLCSINGRDRRKASHWWLEIGNWIIDLTAEQFNRFLEKPLPKIVITRKDSEIGKRYEARWRLKNKLGKPNPKDDFTEPIQF